jgi:hypothetical protein
MVMRVLKYYSISTNCALLILPEMAIDMFTLIAMILVRTFPKAIWGTADVIDDLSIAPGAVRAVDARSSRTTQSVVEKHDIYFVDSSGPDRACDFHGVEFEIRNCD